MKITKKLDLVWTFSPVIPLEFLLPLWEISRGFSTTYLLELYMGMFGENFGRKWNFSSNYRMLFNDVPWVMERITKAEFHLVNIK